MWFDWKKEHSKFSNPVLSFLFREGSWRTGGTCGCSEHRELGTNSKDNLLKHDGKEKKKLVLIRRFGKASQINIT